MEQFVTRMEEFPILQIQAIYERSLNFEVLALKQIGLVYFIPGHRSGLFYIFLVRLPYLLNKTLYYFSRIIIIIIIIITIIIYYYHYC